MTVYFNQKTTLSVAHDAEVLVFNYNQRSTKDDSGALSAGLSMPQGKDVTQILLGEAITSITCAKTKSAPQGSFSITLKPTQEWASILVPGSWCLIFMSSKPLTSEDLATTKATPDGPETNKYQISSYNNPTDFNITTSNAYTTPIKMLGVIMSIRAKKVVDKMTGVITMSYTVSGYDYGYFMHSAVYINSYLDQSYQNNLFNAIISGIAYNIDLTQLNDPVKNINLILNMWSSISSQKLPGLTALSGLPELVPPKINVEIPSILVDLFGCSGNKMLDLVTPLIGLDKRSNKAGKEKDFTGPLPGLKMLHMQTLITNTSLWNLIQTYLNPILNEAYCDLHIIERPDGCWVEPTIIARQMPFNTSNYKGPNAVTLLVDLPKTEIPAVNIIDYDIGYSEYERINFIELNGFSNQGLASGNQEKSSFYMTNYPQSENPAIKRFGLKPKIYHGCDYGIDQSGMDSSAKWMPIVADYWFNTNMYMNGTIQCVGFDRHIAIGENIQLPTEEIIGHIESYTHTFDVNQETGVKVFRTTIEFSKGISAKSTSSKYVYMCDNPSFDEFGTDYTSGNSDVKTSILSDEVKDTVTYTPSKVFVKKEIS